MKRRILAMLLTIAMCISILPMMAFADTKIAYAVFKGDTLSFYYDDEMPKGAYTMPPEDYMYNSDIQWLELNNKVKTVKFDSSFKDYTPTSTADWFYGFGMLETVINANYLNTSRVSDMSYMFYGCANLASLDVAKWDVSNVWSMKNLFSGCSSLAALDVSKWDTSNVTNMYAMLFDCSSLIILNVSSWNTSEVENMGFMFYGCSSLTSIDLAKWNTSNVEFMDSMFAQCQGLRSLDVSKWDVSNVYDMSSMFYNCINLTTLNVADWDTANLTNIQNMFEECKALDELNVSGWYTSNVTNMHSAFLKCSNLTALDVSGWDTSNVCDMSYLFYGCSQLAALDVSNWDTSKVERMYSLFDGCSRLITLDVSNWDTSNVIDMSSMFEDCKNIKELSISNWDTSKVTNMGGVFRNCESIKELDVSNWDTSEVKNMASLFTGCAELTTLDLSSWDTSSVCYDYDMLYHGVSNMFYGCSKLKTIYVSDRWQLSDSAKNESSTMFDNCTQLVGENGTVYDESRSGTDYARIDGGQSNPGYFTFCARVAYDAGEGVTGDVPAEISVFPGTEITLPSSSSFSKSGYKFSGWSDGKSVYVAGDKYTVGTSNVTFEAQWECLHEHSEIKNAKKATTSAEGYTGDTCCTTCGEVLKSGEAIPSLTPEPTPTTNPTPSGEPTPSGNPTPTTAPVPTKDPNLDVGDFVDRCYDVALGREADEAGYDSWKSQLNNGQACGAQVGYGFIFSPEYILKDTSNEQFVKDLYTMFFDREPDEGGFNYWVGMLNDGTAGREQVFAGFANSVEFYELCLKYGVVAGYYVVGVNNEQQGGVNSFVARLYKVCLNRMPDQGGQAGWVIKLMNGEVTGTTCAYGFVFSPEFVGKEPTNVEFVNYMYAAFFGREADEDGLNYWVSQLDGGTASREDIFSGFAGSIEFANLCAGYGINA